MQFLNLWKKSLVLPFYCMWCLEKSWNVRLMVESVYVWILKYKTDRLVNWSWFLNQIMTKMPLIFNCSPRHFTFSCTDQFPLIFCSLSFNFSLMLSWRSFRLSLKEIWNVIWKRHLCFMVAFDFSMHSWIKRFVCCISLCHKHEIFMQNKTGTHRSAYSFVNKKENSCISNERDAEK